LSTKKYYLSDKLIRWVDVKLCRDAVGGWEYLELVERQRKTRTSATDEGRTVPPRILVDIITHGMCGRNFLPLKEKHFIL
jgi:hypothetical protein